MHRFALFGGARWTANGGWLDFIRSAETLDEALPQPGEKHPRPWPLDKSGRIVWWEVFDLQERKAVAVSIPKREKLFREIGLWRETE
jgi:hypothetical protein